MAYPQAKERYTTKQPVEKFVNKPLKKTYLSNRPDIDDIFDELDKLLDFCRFNLLPYNPADLYNKNAKVWQHYLYSVRVEKRKQVGTESPNKHHKREYRRK